MKRWLSLLLIVCIMAPLFAGCKLPGNETLTLMIYMVGSDLESKHTAASNDIDKMLDAGIDTDKINLLLYTGGSEMWRYDIPGDKNGTYLLQKKDGAYGMLVLDESEELSSMGDPATLSSFLSYGYENYPADNYALICWDHGGGPLLGFGRDTRFEGDALDNSELKQALEDSPFNENNKLSFVGFDACLMSSIETADVLQHYADYMIASQETEPGDGWDYSFLGQITETGNVPVNAGLILDSYGSYYERAVSATFHPQTTLACLDLSKTAMNRLFDVMATSLENGEYYQRAIERSHTKSFGDSAGNRGFCLDLVDAGSLSEECSGSFSEESAAFTAALGEFVVRNNTTLDNACGVSLYYPYYGTGVYEQYGSEESSAMTGADRYRDYMERFQRAWKEDWQESDAVFDAGEEEVTDDTLTYTLTEAQKKTFSRAYLNIYREGSTIEGAPYYDLLLLGAPVEPDENGTITVGSNEKIPMVDGTVPMPLARRSRDKTTTGYEAIVARRVYLRA